MNQRLTKYHFFFDVLDVPEKLPLKSTIPKKSESEGYNNPNDTRSDPRGNPQTFNQNMISISGLPSNMVEERLLDRLEKVFLTVGEIKVIRRTNSTKHMLDSIISYLD